MLKNSRKTSRKPTYFGRKFIVQRKFCLEIQSIRHILDSFLSSCHSTNELQTAIYCFLNRYIGNLKLNSKNMGDIMFV